MIEAIVFDKDGCLLDFDKTWGHWAIEFLGKISGGDQTVFEQMSKAIGFCAKNIRFESTSPVIAGTPGEGIDLILPYAEGWTRDQLLEFGNVKAANAVLAPVVDLPPLLNELRGMGLVLGVATNDAEATARQHMRALAVDDQFAMILGFDSGFGGKPEPGMQQAFLEKTGCSAGQCIMVGDSLHDLHSGRAAGMICVGVLTGPAPREELEPDADVILPDIGYLPEWISRRGI